MSLSDDEARELPEFGSLPEGPDKPLRLCQNPQTGMLYLNRLATKAELEGLSRLIFKEEA